MKPGQEQLPAAFAKDSPVPLETILCTAELSRRASRPPDHETENRALLAMAEALASSPGTILQTLANQVLTALRADSAGLSILTKDEKQFYWAAIAGLWQPHIGGGTPREFGPCGDVLDRNAPALFTHWERRYPYLLSATPLAEEGLLVPFYFQGRAVGTIWAIAHDERRKFDAEDLRQLESLARFASAAYQTVTQLNALDERDAALRESRSEITEIRDSHHAALSLVDDAVHSRRLADDLNRKLQNEIGERTRAQEALKEVDRRKDEFLATLSHELRNPLAPLRSALDAMRLTGPHSTEATQIHAIMERQLSRLTRLVDDLLEVSRITQGKLQLQKSRVELATIVQHAVEDTQALIEASGHELSVVLPGEPVIMNADPVRLGQVLTNLLSNAAKYTPAGGRIELSAERRQGGVHLSVRDNGCGIPRDELEEIFDIFAQGEQTSGRADKGLGIGLSLTKSLVEMHGGTIEARSDGVDQGSAFNLWLPIAPEAVSPAPEAAC